MVVDVEEDAAVIGEAMAAAAMAATREDMKMAAATEAMAVMATKAATLDIAKAATASRALVPTLDMASKAVVTVDKLVTVAKVVTVSIEVPPNSNHIGSTLTREPT